MSKLFYNFMVMGLEFLWEDAINRKPYVVIHLCETMQNEKNKTTIK